jgi:endoplasmic reticulum protein 29
MALLRRVALIVLASTPAAFADRGLLELDNCTFDRLVGGSSAMMVRFEKEYPYGDADDAYKELAKAVGDSDAAALVATIGVADPPSPPYRGEYSEAGESEDEEEVDPNGWRDNQDLAARFSIDLESFPQFLLFPAGWKDGTPPAKFEGGHTKENFLRFLQDKAGVWIGLPGQVKELHDLAQGFAAASADERKKALAAAEALDDESAKYYAKVMKKIEASADFVEKETARLTKMLDDGSVAQGKKTQFGRRLNALSSFSTEA